MASCDERLEVLSGLIDGELSAAEELELRRHLDGCPVCAAWWAQLQALSRGLSSVLGRPRAPSTLHARVGRIAPRRSGLRIGVAAGAVLLLAALLALVTRSDREALVPALVEDHHRLVSGAIALAVPSSDPDEVAHGLAARLPFRVAVAEVAGAKLRGGHACSLPGLSAAYLQYERAGERVSVFVYPRGARKADDRCREVGGESLCTFARPADTVAVVASRPETARAFGSAARVLPTQ